MDVHHIGAPTSNFSFFSESPLGGVRLGHGATPWVNEDVLKGILPLVNTRSQIMHHSVEATRQITLVSRTVSYDALKDSIVAYHTTKLRLKVCTKRCLFLQMKG